MCVRSNSFMASALMRLFDSVSSVLFDSVSSVHSFSMLLFWFARFFFPSSPNFRTWCEFSWHILSPIITVEHLRKQHL